jgi:hypothetical protein
MFSHKLPWHGLSDPAVGIQVLQGAFPGSRSDCNNCLSVYMSDEAWYLLESCWKINVRLRPNLLYVREFIGMLKKSHDTRAVDDYTPRPLISTSASSKSVIKPDSVPTLFASHLSSSLSNMSSTLPPASGRVTSLRHRHSARAVPVLGRPLPYHSRPVHLLSVNANPSYLPLAPRDRSTSFSASAQQSVFEGTAQKAPMYSYAELMGSVSTSFLHRN